MVFSVDFLKLLFCLVAFHIEYRKSLLYFLFFKRQKYGKSKVFLAKSAHSQKRISASSKIAGIEALSSVQIWRKGIPYAGSAMLYVICNNLVFYCLKIIDTATYEVFIQSKIFTTAVLFTFFFRKFLSLRQWCALGLLFFGVVSKCSHPGQSIDLHVSFVALLVVLFQTCLSSLASVWNELVLKRDAVLSIHMQNFFMYFFSLLFNALLAFFSVRFSELNYSLFMNPAFFLISIFGAIYGLSASFLLKFVNVLVKGFATAVEVVLAAFFGHLLFLEPLTSADAVALCCVTLAMYFYNTVGWGSSIKIKFGLH